MSAAKESYKLLTKVLSHTKRAYRLKNILTIVSDEELKKRINEVVYDQYVKAVESIKGINRIDDDPLRYYAYRMLELMLKSYRLGVLVRENPRDRKQR